MQSAEEFIAELFHIREYDPQARRDYYLRTRKLKGRKVGSAKTAIARHPATKTAPVVKTTPIAPKKAPEQRRKDTEARVAALQTRLDTLRKVLAELVAQAKVRSGVDNAKPAPQSQKPQTTKQKADAAERSKDFYDKNKDQILSDKEKTLQGQIKRVEEKIREMRAELEKVRVRVAKATPLKRGTRLPRKADPVGAGIRIPLRKENSRG
jgi:hypothetical protein